MPSSAALGGGLAGAEPREVRLQPARHALGLAPGRIEDDQLGGVPREQHVGDLVLDHLELADGLSEGLAIGDVGERRLDHAVEDAE